MNIIKEFQGEYRWLSNFSECPVILDGIVYNTPENAYQAAKTLDIELRKQFLDITPGHAKRLARTLILRDDWESVKYNIMEDLQIQKYNTEKYYNLLYDTGPMTLIQEGNKWHDIYWGVCLRTGKGQNNLGKIIMNIRDQMYNNLLFGNN